MRRVTIAIGGGTAFVFFIMWPEVPPLCATKFKMTC